MEAAAAAARRTQAAAAEEEVRRCAEAEASRAHAEERKGLQSELAAKSAVAQSTEESLLLLCERRTLTLTLTLTLNLALTPTLTRAARLRPPGKPAP